MLLEGQSADAHANHPESSPMVERASRGRTRMRLLTYQLACLTLVSGPRWCVLCESGDGWFKLVQDFPLDRKNDAEAMLSRILRDEQQVGNVAASDRRIFHHPV